MCVLDVIPEEIELKQAHCSPPDSGPPMCTAALCLLSVKLVRSRVSGAGELASLKHHNLIGGTEEVATGDPAGGLAVANADICPGWGTGLIPTKDPRGPLASLSRDSLFYCSRAGKTFLWGRDV